ncbi:hypothetical protein NBRC111893_34 [Lentilactobacillus kosonis]|uniref:Uncharacterized protein n=1 Tax=Lentilactobacillus kosonis TaxID=2810561 RepID=A0A401FHW7_9LACO|nr:hypothetical protein NBRC111893_34 [Lentilactobacillus kosonis]
MDKQKKLDKSVIAIAWVLVFGGNGTDARFYNGQYCDS